MMNPESNAMAVHIFQHGSFREKVLQARMMTTGERLDIAFQLSQLMLEARMATIQMQHPEWSDDAVSQELKRQLSRERTDEEKGYFSSTAPSSLPK